ncbi:MAG: hypothetical protein ACYCZ7_01405 [Minisyncoccota bacterium]
MDEQLHQTEIEQTPREEESSTGSLIGILIIALIIVAGGIYFLFLK